MRHLGPRLVAWALVQVLGAGGGLPGIGAGADPADRGTGIECAPIRTHAEDAVPAVGDLSTDQTPVRLVLGLAPDRGARGETVGDLPTWPHWDANSPPASASAGVRRLRRAAAALDAAPVAARVS